MFIDVLRGLGALAVFYQHVGERVWPQFADFTTYQFQLGQFGVMLFFLCSGFVIPASLEKHGSIQKFWVGRIFRIYPLYWFSLLAAVVLWSLSIYRMPAYFETSPLIGISANITMFQTFMGVPNAIGLYWSLAFEMAFYILVTLLFVVGLHKRTFTVTTLLLLGSIAIGVGFPVVLNRIAPIGLLFNFATMFVGTVFYRVYTNTLPQRALWVTLGLAAVSIALTLGVNFYGRDRAEMGGTQSFLPMLTAWMGAYALFTLSFFTRVRFTNRLLIYFGTISYSIYLMHPLIMALFPQFDSALLTVIVWSAAVLAISSFTYRFVEEPFIALGRRVKIAPAPQSVPSK